MVSNVETDDLRIREIREVSSPWQILAELPVSETAARTTAETRKEIHQILTANETFNTATTKIVQQQSKMRCFVEYEILSIFRYNNFERKWNYPVHRMMEKESNK